MKNTKQIHDIFARIRTHFGVSTTRDAMEKWGIPRGTYNTWVHKDAIPEKRLRDLATKEGLTYEWLLTGEDPLPVSKLYSPEQVAEMYAYVKEKNPVYGTHPLTQKLSKAFDALDDEDKATVIEKVMPYIIERL